MKNVLQKNSKPAVSKIKKSQNFVAGKSGEFALQPEVSKDSPSKMLKSSKFPGFESTSSRVAKSQNTEKFVGFSSNPNAKPQIGYKTSQSTNFESQKLANKINAEELDAIGFGRNFGTDLARKSLTEVKDSFEKEVFPTKSCIQLDPTRKSAQESGIIKSYAVNTNEGLVRDYNEDRISIILNIMQSGKENSKTWPKAAYLAVFDGHCGSNCAEFLRDNLHKFVLRDKEFPSNPALALRNGFKKAETNFMNQSLNGNTLTDRSGSCALVILIVENKLYFANLGDSRAVLSSNNGKIVTNLTNDHKPCTPSEQERILQLGGKIYRTQIQTTSLVKEESTGEEVIKNELVNGPYRVFPGRLSVSRTFGDFEGKLPQLGTGGIRGVVSSDPEIGCVEIGNFWDEENEDNKKIANYCDNIFEPSIGKDADFLIVGCDGVFDRLESEQIVEKCWKGLRAKFSPESEQQVPKNWKNIGENMHDVAASMVEDILEETFEKKAWDNISVILICFKDLIKIAKEGIQSHREAHLHQGFFGKKANANISEVDSLSGHQKLSTDIYHHTSLSKNANLTNFQSILNKYKGTNTSQQASDRVTHN